MKIKTFEFNPLGVNTYVLSDETGECVIIDPSCFYHDEKELLLNYILDNNLIVKHLLYTHLHFDHIFGNNFVVSQFNVQPEANKEDEYLLKNLPEQLKAFGFSQSDEPIPVLGVYLNENDVVTFGYQKLTVLHIPGHSLGSIVFYNKTSDAIFVGDVLFNGSIGRTDLAGGNYEQLIEGIQKKLFSLPGQTVVYPGHGPATTIDHEKKFNPFVGEES